MRRQSNKSLMTTFGTQLRPLMLKPQMFMLTKDVEAIMDTPLQEYKGTKNIFKSGSTVTGTVWKEATRDGKARNVVMVIEREQGRYLINTKDLKPTTKAIVEALKAGEEIKRLQEKVDGIVENAKAEAQEVLKEEENVLDKKYLGFTGKQILAATLGVIILIKIFK
jgi:hypothetical protein